MTDTVAKYMTPNPTTIEANRSVREAAELMRAGDIGDVIVVDDSEVVGIVTDRDIVVRVIGAGGSPEDPVRQACSPNPVTVTSDAPVSAVLEVMRTEAVRRVPVLTAGALAGIVSIGDLAVDRDPSSVLADISAEQPNT
ncbi:CBS domain-containing protein [Georgenia wangjunii]|uniref:CBS domain-containing protein n=1 Tax=Georgenia wangjunii TaxID=3117730 RepID=UPI002F26CC2D